MKKLTDKQAEVLLWILKRNVTTMGVFWNPIETPSGATFMQYCTLDRRPIGGLLTKNFVLVQADGHYLQATESGRDALRLYAIECFSGVVPQHFEEALSCCR